MADSGQTAGVRSVHTFVVLENEQVAEGIYKMVIEAGPLAAALNPGQFINFEVPGNPAHILRVPLSFSRADALAGTIELIYAVVGDATDRLAQMQKGATSTVVGPLGHGWRMPEEQRLPALLIAGGVGAPPIFAAAAMLGEAGFNSEVIVGAQSSSRLVVPSWVRELPGVRAVHIATDDGSAGFHGFTTQLAKEFLQGAPTADKDHGFTDDKNQVLNTAFGESAAFGSIFTCGPSPMMAGVAKLAEDFGLPCQASLEARMSCGFGACNTCNVAMRAGGYKSCCMDGPVMDALEVRWS